MVAACKQAHTAPSFLSCFILTAYIIIYAPSVSLILIEKFTLLSLRK